MMQCIRSLQQIQSEHQGAFVSIGNFDGMHRGHQALLKALAVHAKQCHTHPLVILFEPQPLEFLNPDQASPRLQLLREKLSLLQAYAVNVLCLNFNASFAKMSAQVFVEKILVETLQIKGLFVGHDFCLGHQRQGDVAFLKQSAKSYRFELVLYADYFHDLERISSTAVRALLASNEFSKAAALLGRPYTVSGRVKKGVQRGRTLGIPTINIDLKRQRLLFEGVFAVRVFFEAALGSQWIEGVANIGYRPTIGGQSILLEVHLFKFNRNCYGERVIVECVQKIREEQKFLNLNALKKQIEADIMAAKKIFDATVVEERYV